MSAKPKSKHSTERMLTLHKIIGNTSLHNSCFTACTSGAIDHYIAYAAGAMVVIYSAASHKQVKYFQADQGISALAFSADGRFIAAGERGRHPLVHVWETKTGILRHKLKVHSFGVSSIQFSPDESRLVTAGYKHDGKVCLWDMSSGVLLASGTVQNQIYALSYSHDGSYFVTAGDHHLKFWYPVTSPDGAVQLDGKAASILAEHQSATFLDVSCGKAGHASAVYTTTSTGLLCTFSSARLMERWVQMDAQFAYSVDLTRNAIAIGCDNGVVRIFEPESLAYVCTLPYPIPLFANDDRYYAATTGLRFVGDDKLVCLYADRSTVVWDIHDPHNVSRIRSSVAHRDCIWDVQFISTPSKPDVVDVGETMDDEANAPLPEGTFVTCAADGTVRMWNTSTQLQRTSKWRSMWSRDMLHVLETSEARGQQTSQDPESNLMPPEHVSTGMIDPQVPPHSRSNSIPRCLAIHPSGAEVAIGDREGNLKVFDLESMQLSLTQLAHNAEILTMHYSPVIMTGDPEEEQKPLVLLATAGRDRLVHAFDATDHYRHKQTLDNHSASVTAVRFTGDGRRLLTCGGDKTMTLNKVTPNEIHRYASASVSHGNIYGLTVDATNKFAITSGHDKRINIWNIATARNTRVYKVQGATDDLYKTDTDPAGTVLAVCSLDKHVRLIDFFSGELIDDVSGHSESVTAVRFSPDGEHLISVGGDGCIFIWRVAEELLQQMRSRLMELYSTMERKKQDSGVTKPAPGGKSAGQKAGAGATSSSASSRDPQIKVSYGEGNAWAGPRVQSATSNDNVTASRNQWAQRLQSDGPYQIHGLQRGGVEKRQLDFTAESQVGTIALPPGHVIPSSTARSTDLLEAQDDVMVGSDEDEEDSKLFKFREKAPSPVENDAPPTGDQSDADTEDYEDDFNKDDDAQNEVGEDAKSAAAAKRLDKWLEEELKSESQLDEAVRTSFATEQETEGHQSQFESPAKGATILRQSFSSNFFKEQQDGTPKRPKPAEEEPKSDPAEERRQQTKLAVEQMRSRLKAMGLFKSMKQPLKAQDTNAEGGASEDLNDISEGRDSEQKRSARSWRDVEGRTATSTSEKSVASEAQSTQAVLADTAEHAPIPPPMHQFSPLPATPTKAPLSPPSAIEPATDSAVDDYKSALKDLATITQRALAAYKGMRESQAAAAAGAATSGKQATHQQEALQEIRQSLSAVHLSLGMILRAPEATLTQTIDTAIDHIQDPKAATSELRPASTGLDASGSVATQDVATILEHYSNMLVGMVGQKMNSMSMAFSTHDVSISHADRDLDTSS